MKQKTLAVLAALAIVAFVVVAFVVINRDAPRSADIDYSTATFDNLLQMGYTFEEALDIFEAEIFALFVQWRQNTGLPALALDEDLDGASRHEATLLANILEDMAAGTASRADVNAFATASRAVLAQDLRTWVSGDIDAFSTPASIAYDWLECV